MVQDLEGQRFGLKGWGKDASGDNRTLEELAEAVLAAEAAPVPEDAAGGPHEGGLQAEDTQAEATDSPGPEEPGPPHSKGRRSGLVALGLLIVCTVGVGLIYVAMQGGSGGDGTSGSEGNLALAPGGGEAPAAAAPTPDSTAPPPAPETAPPAQAPLPAETPAQSQATPAPVPVNNPAPAPTAAPTAAPPPAPALTVHVADLWGKSQGAKVSVRIVIHDSSHSPVAGAAVSGAWSGAYSGTATCTTDTTGSCTVRTPNLPSSGSVTFAVAGVSLAGASYDPASNHDADGDSNGTSITVAF